MLGYEKEEFITVQVPKSRVEDVYRLLSTPREKDLPSSTVSFNGDSQWWTQDRIAKLKREISNQTVLTLLNLTAERAGEWVGFDELCRKTGSSSVKARGDLGALTRAIKRLFRDNDKAWWPVEVRGTVPISYRMPAEIARRWGDA